MKLLKPSFALLIIALVVIMYVPASQGQLSNSAASAVKKGLSKFFSATADAVARVFARKKAREYVASRKNSTNVIPSLNQTLAQLQYQNISNSSVDSDIAIADLIVARNSTDANSTKETPK